MVKKILIFLGLFLLMGCTNKIQEANCTINIENDMEGYIFKANYKIYYDKYEYVTNIEKQETYKSSQEDVLDYFNRVKNIEYENLSKYGGYEYTIDQADETVNINVKIDLRKTDVKEMIKNKEIDKEYTSARKLTLYGMKDYYESKGAVCDIE